MLRTTILAATLLMIAGSIPARADQVRFNFTGTIVFTFGVPDAGTAVSGYLTFDPSAPLAYGGPGYGTYSESAPAALVFTTNGGFTLQQTLTTINIGDEFESGVADYYEFDADLGSISPSTDFSRLELGLSNNSNPFIPNINIPTTPPDFSAFQFYSVNFYDFADGTEDQVIHATPDLADEPIQPPCLSPQKLRFCWHRR